MKEELEKLVQEIYFTGFQVGQYTQPSDETLEKRLNDSLTSIINLVDKEVIGSADEWDKKYPLSIKQDIKSRNNLRIEQRAKLKGVNNGRQTNCREADRKYTR